MLDSLEHFNASQNRLTGPIPEELGAPPALEILNLSGNMLTGTVPPALLALEGFGFGDNAGIVSPDRAALEALYHATGGPDWVRQDGWLTDRPVGEWEGVSAGQRVAGLNLYSNGLRGELPPEIGQLTELSELKLQTNQLTGDIPEEVFTLTALRTLSLHSNQLTGELPPEIGNLTNLVTLALAFNRLSGPVPSEVGGLPELWQLALEDSGLTGCVPVQLERQLRAEGNVGLPFC